MKEKKRKSWRKMKAYLNINQCVFIKPLETQTHTMITTLGKASCNACIAPLSVDLLAFGCTVMRVGD